MIKIQRKIGKNRRKDKIKLKNKISNIHHCHPAMTIASSCSTIICTSTISTTSKISTALFQLINNILTTSKNTSRSLSTITVSSTLGRSHSTIPGSTRGFVARNSLRGFYCCFNPISSPFKAKCTSDLS